MKNTALTVAIAAMGLSASLPASAATIGFNGLLDPSQWTQTVLGTLIGGSPNPGTTSMSNTDLSITGGDLVSPDPGNSAPGCDGGMPGGASRRSLQS